MGGCRRILGLDGCFLKHTCKDQLLTIMGRDTNKAAGENNSQVTRHGKQIRCFNCQANCRGRGFKCGDRGVMGAESGGRGQMGAESGGRGQMDVESYGRGGMGSGIRAIGTNSGGKGGRSDGRENMGSARGRRGGARGRRGGGRGGRRGGGKGSTSRLKRRTMLLFLALYQKGTNSDFAAANHSTAWLNICIGAAHGLDYLYTGTGVESRVIHHDVKSSNVLLNEKLAAKISYFGVSRIGLANQLGTTNVYTCLIRGAIGYMDFEPALDFTLDEQQHSLVGWSKHCIKEGKTSQIINPCFRGQVSANCLKEFRQIAYECLLTSSKDRPTMTNMLSRLEFVLQSANDQKRNGRTTFIKKAWLLLLTKAPSRDANKAAGENNSQVTRHEKQIRCFNYQGIGHNKASYENPYILKPITIVKKVPVEEENQMFNMLQQNVGAKDLNVGIEEQWRWYGSGIRAICTDSGGRGGRSDGRETMGSARGRKGGARGRRGGGRGGRIGGGRGSTSRLKVRSCFERKSTLTPDSQLLAEADHASVSCFVPKGDQQ
nr:serine/threonine/dual specificity protein kinase, catalytic domain-containing protein [Tanacetum cinerariifolium]